MNKYKPIVVALTFIVGLGLGYEVTSFFVFSGFNGKGGEQMVTVGISSSDNRASSGTDSLPKEPSISEQENALLSSDISAEVPDENVTLVVSDPKWEGKGYSIIVAASNVPSGVSIRYDLYAQNALRLSSESPKITGVPPTDLGLYQIKVVDKASGKVLCEKSITGLTATAQIEQKPVVTVNKMSVSEFQSLLLNKNDVSILGGKNPLVAKRISFKYSGLKEGENRPDDVLSIREKIAMGVWSSAQVVSVGYDAHGKVNSAVVAPVY